MNKDRLEGSQTTAPSSLSLLLFGLPVWIPDMIAGMAGKPAQHACNPDRQAIRCAGLIIGGGFMEWQPHRLFGPINILRCRYGG